MKHNFHFLSLVAGLAASSVAVAQPPSWSPEQTAVWSVIDRSWSDEVARNGRWPEQYAHPNMVSWGADWPLPRYRDSVTRWTRYYDRQGRILQYELSPAAITLAGNTAVVHYTAVTMFQRDVPRGETPPEPHRDADGVVETLVREGGEWRFLSSASYPIGDDD